MIEEVERNTGKPVVLRPEPGLSGRARASYAASDPDTSRHLVLYDPALVSAIDHLVPHELGHISLFAGARDADHKVPLIGARERRIARTSLLRELPALAVRAFFSDNEVSDYLDSWSEGLTMQVYNYPQDTLIERSLFEGHPALHSSQRDSISGMAQEAHAALNPRIVALTPRTVTNAAQSMNYALLKSCSGFLQAPWMVRPYRNTSMERTGEDLLDLLRTRAPEDLNGCLEMTGEWSRHLGIGSWYRLESVRPSVDRVRDFWEQA